MEVQHALLDKIRYSDRSDKTPGPGTVIPRNDDIDIEIPLMYYIDFFKTFSKELPDDMLYQTSITAKTITRIYCLDPLLLVVINE